MFITQEDKDTLITYVQDAEECDNYREGYEEGFRRVINLVCDIISTCDEKARG